MNIKTQKYANNNFFIQHKSTRVSRNIRPLIRHIQTDVTTIFFNVYLEWERNIQIESHRQ